MYIIKNKSYLLLIITISLALVLVGSVVMLNTLSKIKYPKVISFNPKDQQTNVGIFPVVSIEFSQQLSDQQIQKVNISLLPNAKGGISLSTDRKTIIFTPIDPLKTDQKYEVNIGYGDNTKLWSFRTVTDKQLSIEDITKSQTMADNNYSNLQSKVLQDYPWYNNLPLQTKNYFVYFDTNAKIFIADIYPTKQSTNTVDQQVDALKLEINKKLMDLKIDVSKYNIVWSIK